MNVLRQNDKRNTFWRKYFQFFSTIDDDNDDDNDAGDANNITKNSNSNQESRDSAFGNYLPRFLGFG